MSEHRHHEIVVELPLTEAVPSSFAEGLKDSERRTDTLTELLQDEVSSRIALYLPREWLPTAQQPEYQEAYLDAWWKLLNQVDYRADFVDGDMGEIEDQSPRPLVVKAAHLLPWLIEANLLQAEDVEYLRREAGDSILGRSLADTTASVPVAPVSLADYPALMRELSSQVKAPTNTDARAKWLYESGVERITRDVARNVEWSQLEQLMAVDDAVQVQIALRSLARFGRNGAAVESALPWVQDRRQHDDALVGRQAAAVLRQFYHAGVVPLEQVDERGIPALEGAMSGNIRFMEAEVAHVKAVAERISLDPELTAALYPTVLFAGSRLKGYGDDSADIDTAVLVRPGAQVSGERLAELFGQDEPKQIAVEMSADGLRIDPDWSHLLYNALWIGDEATVRSLRRELSRGYSDSTDQRVALGRLEQDALRYRLMHKGYERHSAIEADDVALPAGGIDRQSTYWDPGYRRLATQLFAERVRMPKSQK